jgi:hypothetical protein
MAHLGAKTLSTSPGIASFICLANWTAISLQASEFACQHVLGPSPAVKREGGTGHVASLQLSGFLSRWECPDGGAEVVPVFRTRSLTPEQRGGAKPA